MSKTVEQALRIQQWEQIAATIEDDIERYAQAYLRFGNDPDYIVWIGGIVTTADIDGPTFDQGAGINRKEYVAEHGHWFDPETGLPPMGY